MFVKVSIKKSTSDVLDCQFEGIRDDSFPGECAHNKKWAGVHYSQSRI